MRKIGFLLALFISLNGYAKESCQPQAIGLDSESPIVKKLYYTGTCHYRNGDYQAAANEWQKLATLKDIPEQYTELQVSSLNNLGYLLFFGYGVERDQTKAITYWRKAVSLGNTEAEYHLCHAYGDSDQPTYDPDEALPHCNKAKTIYSDLVKRDANEEEILSQIEKYIATIKRAKRAQIIGDRPHTLNRK